MMEKTLRPPLPWLPATVAVAVLAVLSMASFVPLLEGSLGGFLAKGPAAVDPHIGSELSTLMSESLLIAIQRVLHAVGMVLFLAVAFLLVRTRLSSPVSPLAALMLAALGTSLFAPLSGLPRGDVIERIVGSVTSDSLPGFWTSVAGLSTLTFLATFPDGRWSPKWSRWLIGGIATVTIGSWLMPGSFADPRSWSDPVRWFWLIGLPVVLISAQVGRMRQEQNRPARSVVISVAVAILGFVLLWVLQPELSADALGLVVATPRLRAVYAANLLILLTAAVVLIPVSVSFAIFRHRLFDLDLLVNRALVYGTATALIGAFFVGLATLIVTLANNQDLTQARVGSGPVGVILGTGLVLTFQPLRKRVQSVVDRRFFRSRYDARQVIERFSRNAAKLVDPQTLANELESTVMEALGPVFTTLHQEGEVLLFASNAMTEPGTVLPSTHPEMFLQGPFDSRDAAALVPLLAGGTLNGVLELGRRSSGARFSSLDLDLLDQLARSAGPALQLAREMQIREREAQQRERMSHELELARKIQHDLLPHETPILSGWVVDALYKPAREVGGDFYDWMELPDGRLVVVIGDVSDKGIPAALVMATCRTLLRIAATSAGGPGAVLAEVNERLHPDIPAAMFVTCQVVVIDPITGEVVMANAGHNLPICRRSHLIEEIVARGMPLGLMPGMIYEEAKTHLEVGDSLVLTSDGITEAHDPESDMFGTSRTCAAVMGGGPNLIQAVLAEHRVFVGQNWDQEDDITLVTVTRTG